MSTDYVFKKLDRLGKEVDELRYLNGLMYSTLSNIHERLVIMHQNGNPCPEIEKLMMDISRTLKF